MSFLTSPDGVRLRYTDRGSGPRTIVLVHGWKGSHRLWDPAVHRLARDFRVIAFDNRGMGESDKPGGRYDFEVLAADLGFVLETLDVRAATLVGWSMGATISLEYLARGGRRVARLALVNGPLRLERSAEFPWSMSPEQLDAYMCDLASGWPGAELAFAREACRDSDPELVDLYYRVALQMPLVDAIRIVEEQRRVDHVPALEALQMPVLALYGRQDPYYPAELATFIAEHARDGRSVILEESAHPVQFHEPDRFAQAIGAFARGEL